MLTNRQQSMNKHIKHSAKLQLQQVIANRNAIPSSCMVKNKPLIEIERHGQNRYPNLISPLEEEIAHIITAFENHKRYYQIKMEIEKHKFINHFAIMEEQLRQERKAGLDHIDVCINDLETHFQLKKNNMRDKIEKLRKADMKLQEKIMELKKETKFEIILFQVHLSDLTNFRQEIQKYTMSPWEKPITHSLPTDQEQCRASTSRFSNKQLLESKEVHLKDEGTQTEAASVLTDEEVVDQSEDDILCCEEQLGRKISNTSRRRRRYAVGRRDVIKEQDQSQQVSSLISDGEMVC